VIAILAELFFVYFLYTRVFRLYYKVWYYKRQGVPAVKGIYPCIGNLPAIVSRALDTSTNISPLVDVFRTEFPEGLPPVAMLVYNFTPGLYISSPELLDEVYGSKNMFF
jgi:hypothetical protein